MSFEWVEFAYRPKKDGLHDSGYRFLCVTGVRRLDDGTTEKVVTHQWADHIVFYGPSNIDVEPDGTIRVMARAGDGWAEPPYYHQSDAEFYPNDMQRAIKYLRVHESIEMKL